MQIATEPAGSLPHGIDDLKEQRAGDDRRCTSFNIDDIIPGCGSTGAVRAIMFETIALHVQDAAVTFEQRKT